MSLFLSAYDCITDNKCSLCGKALISCDDKHNFGGKVYYCGQHKNTRYYQRLNANTENPSIHNCITKYLPFKGVI